MLGMPRKDIEAVTMPGFGTTDQTYYNALELMRALGVSIREIDIKPSCLQHFRDIGHDASLHDLTYENVQARERTQVVMDIANKIGGLAIGTGDLSELALGWCTYNGDHMSMYSVNCGIPKTLVRYLVQWVADTFTTEQGREVLYRIIDTPISPELLPPTAAGKINQKTEDIIGPYELHDFFLFHLIRNGASPLKTIFLAEHAFAGKYGREIIVKWLDAFIKRFFRQQYKRSCLPDGPKVGTASLSPRGDWRMPSDAEPEAWLNDLNETNRK
jgi:NAD+ synthase (glutamine-hydrolysing)